MINEDKVYSIGLGNGGSYALTQVKHDIFHGLRCLKGVARALSDQKLIEGKQVYIPFEQIIAITEYDSWAAFVATSKPAKPAAKRRSKAKKRR